LVHDELLEVTDYIRINNPIYSFNGLKFRKTPLVSVNFNQFIVKDIPDYIIISKPDHIYILIPESKLDDLELYLSKLSEIDYLTIEDSSELTSIGNFYNINLSNRPFSIQSNNRFAFSSKESYQRYKLESIDIHYSFITQLEEKLKVYGVELKRYPIDDNVRTVNRIIYKITELDKQVNYKSPHYPNNDLPQHKSTIEFELSFPDLILFIDFKTRYQDNNLISNFTEFYTEDKLGVNWISNVVWSPINTDFNQDYSQDNQGNTAFTASFTADLYYYVIYDEIYEVIQEIILTLVSHSIDADPDTSVTELSVLSDLGVTSINDDDNHAIIDLIGHSPEIENDYPTYTFNNLKNINGPMIDLGD
jgi:hypothetical protein